MIENTNTKQFYPGPILNNTLEITDFLFNDAEQIKIKHSKLNEEGILIDVDLNYPTDYEVTKVLPSDINAAEAALTASTGQIMLKNVNVLAGEKLTVYRVSLIIQDKDYPRTGAFPAATHEGALDYLTMQNQEQKDEIDRALKVPISTQNFEGSLPLPIPSRALKINNDGTGFEMSEFDPDLALVTTEEFKNQSQQAAIEAENQKNVATEQATIATQQAGIATEKTIEVIQAKEEAVTTIKDAETNSLTKINSEFNKANEWFERLNAIPYIPVGTILPTTGAIDESLGYQRYANGQLIANVSSQAPDLVKFLEFQEAHAPNLLCSETEWQTALTLSTLGQVGKYVWNKEEDSVRIPRIVNIQGMMDMNTVGNMVEAGLPNITATVIARVSTENSAEGATSGYRFSDWGLQNSNNTTAWRTQFNASLSNPIYGNSNTVQEESILYPYVLQIATGVQYKTPVQNELMSNNPFFFGYSQFFKVAPNNISWLKSAAQWNSAKTHGDYYNWLTEERRNPKDIPAIANVIKVGNVIDEDGVLSGFSYTNWIQTPSELPLNGNTWEMIFKIKTPSVLDNPLVIAGERYTNDYQNTFALNPSGKLILQLSTAHTSYDLVVRGTAVLNTNTEYYVKCSFNGTVYEIYYSLNGKDYILDGSTESSHSLPNASWNIGRAYWTGAESTGYAYPFEGTIDLNESYINIDGQRWWSGVKSKVRLHTEDYNDYDWVINQSNQTFRLPLLNGGENVVEVDYSNSTVYNVTSSGMQFTVEKDGIIVPDVVGQSEITLKINGTIVESNRSGGSTSLVYMTGSFQVKKGDIVWITATYQSSNHNIRFFPYINKGHSSLYFYVGGVAKNEHLVDVGRIEEKVDTLVPDNSSLISDYGMPSNKYINLTLGASGTKYTAPANGYFAISKITNGTNQNVTLRNTGKDGSSTTWGTHVLMRCMNPISGGSACAFIPASKGDIVEVSYSAGGALESFSFIYAQGEV